MSHNIVEKIWQQHVVQRQAGFPDVLAIDFALLHEVTSAQAFAELDRRGLPVHDPKRFLATIDHSIPTREDRHQVHDPQALKQMTALRENCQQHGIALCDVGSQKQGIVHVIGPELGLTQPGMTLVCGDSHTATHGAFGALAFGIGTSTLAHVMATGALLMNPPRVMQVQFNGQLPQGVYAKDMIMHLIAQIGVDGGTGLVLEYTGQAVRDLSMEQRMTLCNMSIECGAVAGLVAPDQTTFEYLQGRPHAPQGAEWDAAVKHWQTLVSDPGCRYDRSVTLDIGQLAPMVSWGTNPEQAIPINQSIPHAARDQADALNYVGMTVEQAVQGVPIDWAFVGSCTNGRIEDLRVVADILRHRVIDPRVTMYVVPGSEAVRQQAIDEGLDRIFQQAGAEFRQPGCSMCLGMNDDRVPVGARCISTTNRNFIGRQGTGSITHLASPATVAHSALAGYITHPISPMAQQEAS
ncbi:3-isopropylmalate dehydratase large subunit [Marinicella meishanensis]|uniref:3-isopropylmalate dehydratase large subunit n=1 Tax=Marinicella meishanensis TaxID=2873263 RepID=UPI001CBA9536|nr:3-isopropylmalate dehydratase large subunit [Marinicella sp. NBU2979]